MSSSISKLTVYNLALAELEQGPIVSLASDNQNVKTLNNAYELALRTCLKSRNWDFATTFATLVLISDADNITPFAYQYALPVDFLEIQKIYDSDNKRVDYIRTADGLYTDASPAYLQYTKYFEDYSQFDENFIELISMTLAEFCAAEITGDLNKQDFISKKNDRLDAIAASKSVGRTRKHYNIDDGSSYIFNRY
jgi:hypothetical protein